MLQFSVGMFGKINFIQESSYRANNFMFFLFGDQKMEIKTEADDVDEGVSPNELNGNTGHSSKWTSPKIRKKLRSALSFTNKGVHSQP